MTGTKLEYDFSRLLEALPGDNPCGENLEYDPANIELFLHVAHQEPQQYGDFVATAPTIAWADVAQSCLSLLSRSKSIHLAVLLTRCATRLDGAVGLHKTLALLADLVETFPESIHPLPDEEDDLIRSNALTALADPTGLLSDIRQINLTNSGLSPVSIRSIEQQITVAHGLSETVRAQLTAMQQTPSIAATLNALAQCHVALERLVATSNKLLSIPPALEPLEKLLSPFAGLFTDLDSLITNTTETKHTAQKKTKQPKTAQIHTPTTENAQPQNSVMTSTISSRDTARQDIERLQRWFEQHEPSSPVSLLLFQAASLIGKRFEEVATAIPADMLEKWGAERTAGNN